VADKDLSSPQEFFAGHPLALEVYERVRSVLTTMGSFEVRVSKSQVAFRRRRGFAYLWLPGQYLSAPSAEVVLSIALGRHHPSRRFKEVAHPARQQWMHHLEVRNVGELDRDVEWWLREAFDRAP
jgi:hypothetical protein